MKRLSRNYGCPVELSLAFVGGKWRTVILAWLKEAPHRYGELRKRMPGLADKVLTHVRMGRCDGASTESAHRSRAGQERAMKY